MLTKEKKEFLLNQTPPFSTKNVENKNRPVVDRILVQEFNHTSHRSKNWKNVSSLAN